MDNTDISEISEYLQEEQDAGKNIVFGHGESYQEARNDARTRLPDDASDISYFPEDGIETGDDLAVFASYASGEDDDQGLLMTLTAIANKALEPDRTQESPGASAEDYQEDPASFTDSFKRE